MPRIIVLGAGLVGAVLADDLTKEPGFEVTVADIDDRRLAEAANRSGSALTIQRCDISDNEALRGLIEPFDLVIGAMPGYLGWRVLCTVIEAGKHVCDISFMPEDPLQLDDPARSSDVVVVVDCGVAPGLSNMLAAREAWTLDVCDRIEILVGGLPRERKWPFEYKAAFSPADVIEEYTRPARIVEHGRTITREALSDPELIDFDGVGTLEAFNTDGLRTLIDTLDVPEMKERTLRYPGHRALVEALRRIGLFDQTPIDVGGVSVRPLDVTSALLFPQWTYAPGEADLTVMRIVAEGEHDGRTVRRTWDMFDVADEQRDISSMARTTAFPCAIVARMILDGTIRETGVTPPEMVASIPARFKTLMRGLEERGVVLRDRTESLNNRARD